MNERGIIFTYYNTNENFRRVEILTQVHDSMAIQVPLDLPIQKHAEILCAIKQSMEIPLECDGRIIHTPVDLVINRCLNKKKGVEIKNAQFSENIDTLCDILESAGEKLGLQYLPF